MCHMKIDFPNEAIIIPKKTMEAIGSPEEVTFLYNREQSILALAAGGPPAPPIKRRGRKCKHRGIVVAEHWNDDVGCYVFKTILTKLSFFYGPIPNYAPERLIRLNGVYLGKRF